MKILITGASSGIGAALCKHYAKPGVTLYLLSRNKDELENVAKSCQESGAETHTYSADVSDAHEMNAAAKQILGEGGVPDVVIANAGIRIADPEQYENSEDAHHMMMVNYIGVINSFVPFIESMKARKSGHLVAISSIAALRATPNSGIYSASKASVNLWTEALRLKLAPDRIYVTTACSGFVRTAMTADLPFYMPGILSPEQAAHIIAKAITDRRSRIVFPWQSRIIWGIFSALPGDIYDQVILLAKRLWPSQAQKDVAHEV